MPVGNGLGGVVVGNGLGFSDDFGNGLRFVGWKRAWWRGGMVVGNGPGFADLSLDLPISAWACRSRPGFAVCSLVEWWLLLGFGGYSLVGWWLLPKGRNEKEKRNEERKKKFKIK